MPSLQQEAVEIDRVKSLLRKLYRTGQGRTVEAVRARERIDELTKKYGIDLRSVIDHEKRLAGVIGSEWRSSLLVSIATAFDCQVFDQIEGKKRFAVISGKWDDVAQVAELFRLAEVRVAVQFTAWWREKSAAFAAHRQSPSQWPPPPRFTRQQERQARPILLRFMAMSAADTFEAGIVARDKSVKRPPSARREAKVTYTPPPPAEDRPAKDGSYAWTGPLPESSPGNNTIPLPKRVPPPPKSVKQPPPAHSGTGLDGEIDKLVRILGPDEAKALGEGAIDSGAAMAVALREIVQKPRLLLAVRSVAFPRQARARAQAAEHVRKVLSRFPGAR